MVERSCIYLSFPANMYLAIPKILVSSEILGDIQNKSLKKSQLVLRHIVDHFYMENDYRDILVFDTTYPIVLLSIWCSNLDNRGVRSFHHPSDFRRHPI